MVSKAYYGQLASLYIDAAKPEGYPIVSMNAYQRSPLVPFMGVAHAGFVDWIADNAFDTLVSAIGFMIPYEEGIGLVKQVYYLAKGDDDFDSLELTLNALGVASFIPILKPLLPLTKALKGFLRPLIKRGHP